MTWVLLMDLSTSAPWGSDWVWSLPLIIVTVVFHSFALGLLNQGVAFALTGNRKKRLIRLLSMFVVGGSALCATMLHAFEASMWALAYCLVGALPDRKSAMLYSLIAMTTYGTPNINLEPRWHLMGSLEALDGWILFGLTTAFMFTVIQRVWSNRNVSTSRKLIKNCAQLRSLRLLRTRGSLSTKTARGAAEHRKR